MHGESIPVAYGMICSGVDVPVVPVVNYSIFSRHVTCSCRNAKSEWSKQRLRDWPLLSYSLLSMTLPIPDCDRMRAIPPATPRFLFMSESVCRDQGVGGGLSFRLGLCAGGGWRVMGRQGTPADREVPARTHDADGTSRALEVLPCLRAADRRFRSVHRDG